MVLTKKEESDMCLACGECCKRYSITVLPHEVEKLSKKLGITQKKFLETHCELFVKVYPKSTPGILTFPTVFFPKKIGELLTQDLKVLPTSFFVLPQITLKRKSGVCRYLNKDNTCQVYKERPNPCKLFPFMVVPGYEEQYPFCELFKVGYKDVSKQTRSYSKQVKQYFTAVDKKGFVGLWKKYPMKGKFFLNELLLGEITISELNEMMATHTNK
jgi:Fe-S-cluster containining protein